VINLPLLQKALDHIEAHPEEWDQESWGRQTACGTTACLAGHIALMDGWTPVRYGLQFGDWVHVEKNGVRQTAGDAAEESLGVPDVSVYDSNNEYVGYLWSGINGRADLWRMANILAEGRLTLPVDLQE
jgi:hypothetical protein